MTHEIANFSHYTTEMKKSMLDKLFFLPDVKTDVYIDYGCGDGTLINFASQIFPDQIFIGYDSNTNMIATANEINYGVNHAFFINDLEDMPTIAGTKTLILSSVLHEIINYSTTEEINKFYSWVGDMNFDYIVIRDMMYQSTVEYNSAVHFNDIKRLFFNASVEQLAQIKDFENAVQKLDSQFVQKYDLIHAKDFNHFLLKYRYTENWKREVEENYFFDPIYIERLKFGNHHMIPKYDVISEHHFTPQFIKDTVKHDFNIDMKCNTHFKMILKKGTK